MNVFLLSGPGILKPNLCNTLTEPGHWCDPFQVLSIWIAVNLKIGLQHLQLLFGECGSNTFCFTFMIAICIATIYRRWLVVKMKFESTFRPLTRTYLRFDVIVSFFRDDLTYRHWMWFHRQWFPNNVPYIKLDRLTMRIVHQLITGDRMNRMQNMPNEILILVHVEPNPMTKCHGSILNTLHQSFYAIGKEIKILFTFHSINKWHNEIKRDSL